MDVIEPGEREIGQRLDHVLAHRFGVSRRAVWRWIEAGAVQLNDAPTTLKQKGDRLQAGDRLNVRSDVSSIAPQPEAKATLSPVQKGTGWLGFCKPAGMPVEPRRAEERGTVLNHAMEQAPEAAGVGEGGLKSGVVHRLDTPTSGALVMATDDAMWHKLRQRFERGRMQKCYHALVHGRMTESRHVTMPLRIQRHRPAYVEVVDPSNAERARVWSCSLHYRPLVKGASTTLLAVRLETGFLHQIRVMAAHLGHPVVGDARYGRPGPLDHQAGRMMLHARSLGCDLFAFRCPWPADFRAAAHRLLRDK
jgi:23S rRNA pseudouridine1911/1915/1917 synthase